METYINFKNNLKEIYIEKPKEPELHECCGCECIHCVWVEYFNKLQEYQKYQNKKY